MNGINRDPLPFWQNREHLVNLPISETGAYGDFLGQRALDSFAEFQRQMNHDLYGDDEPYMSPTPWQRFRDWLGDNRITNAWLVLIGREDIDRGYP